MRYRKRHESSLRFWWRMNGWFVLGFVAFLLLLGLIGHIEVQDLTKWGVYIAPGQ